jgi:hypothetical protein
MLVYFVDEKLYLNALLKPNVKQNHLCFICCKYIQMY